MIRRPPRSTRTDTLFPYTTLFRSVSFGSTGVTVPWDDACPSLLDLAEQAGLSPDFNCRSGLCNTCMSTLVSGAVDYFEEPLDPPRSEERRVGNECVSTW